MGKGRPRKDTDAIVKRLCDAISLGCTYDLACKWAGIHPTTLRLWRLEAAQAKPGSRARRVIDLLEEAEGKAVMRWLGHLEEAARNGCWQASAWKLERRYFSEYGRQVLQHDGQVTVTSQPEWQALRSSILAALADLPEARQRLAAVLMGEPIPLEMHHNGHANGTGH